MDKKSLRKEVKARVGALSSTQKKEYSAEITRLVIPLLSGAESVFVYLSTENEADTADIIKYLWQEGKRVFVPKVSGGNMLLSPYKKGDTLIRGDFGLRETAGDTIEFYGADVNIIPLVAYDLNRNRLGHGGGYYDKYLALAKGKTYALAFSAQCTDKIEAEQHDVKPNLIITEKGIVK